jgi:hypothetical protein
VLGKICGRRDGPKDSKRDLDSTYLTVLPGLPAVLYFVTHPYRGRNDVRRQGWTEEVGVGPGILGLV